MKQTLLGLAVLLGVAFCRAEELESRSYRFAPSAYAKMLLRSGADEEERGKSLQELEAGADFAFDTEVLWRRAFSSCGVQWPVDARLGIDKRRSRLEVTNTPANLAVLEKAMREMLLMPFLVEVDARFVRAKRAALEAVGYFEFDRPPAKELYSKLLAQKGVSVLASPCVQSIPGGQILAKGVTELSYPRDFDVWIVCGRCATTNDAPKGGTCPESVAVEPQDFTVREIGTILEVTVDVEGEADLLSLDLDARYVGQPLWKDFGLTVPPLRPDGSPTVLPMQQPIFPCAGVRTHYEAQAGETSVHGGVTDGTEAGKDDFYLFFITPRLLDLEGKALPVDGGL